jgi:hypothetical protein
MPVPNDGAREIVVPREHAEQNVGLGGDRLKYDYTLLAERSHTIDYTYSLADEDFGVPSLTRHPGLRASGSETEKRLDIRSYHDFDP